MSNRFPPLSAPIPQLLDRQRGDVMPVAPLCLRSLPMGDMLVLAAIGLLLTLA
jgi:hypothetical protein